MSLKSKPRLGRGLSSLISISELPIHHEIAVGAPPTSTGPSSTLAQPETEANPPASTQTQTEAPEAEQASKPGIVDGLTELPIALIVPNPHQPRKQIDEASLAELTASLKSTGIIQPIVVRLVQGQYQIIAGERRWRAAQRAGMPTIPVILREVDSFTQAQMALVENVQRENLNPMDRAGAYRELMNQLGLTQAELAGRLGEERSTIANHLRLLELASGVRERVATGQLSLGHAKLLAGVADLHEQERLAKAVVEQELSVRNLERLLQPGVHEEPLPALNTHSAHLRDLEKSLSRQLGMRVQVRAAAKKGKGRLVVHYASLDQFDDLLNRLGIVSE